MSVETKGQENGVGPVAPMRHVRTWSQVARLAGEALTALEAGKTKDARDLLTTIRGVALNADRKSPGS
jgi:hypothetical protein